MFCFKTTKCNSPFALAIDLVLVEGYLDKFVFATTLVGPSADVFFADPPVYIVDHESCGSAGVSWAIIVFALLALCTLLLRCLFMNVEASRASCGCYLLGALVMMAFPVCCFICRLLNSLVTVLVLGHIRCVVRCRSVRIGVRSVRVGYGGVVLCSRVLVGVIAVDVDIEVVVVSHICCGMSSQLQ